jgi:hypothetical protein
VIYFIHDETSRTIKIGCAWNPNRRLSTLQISTSNKLVLLGSIAGTKKVEKKVHALVYQHCGKLGEPGARPLHVSGEWFDDRILPFVRELMASPNTFLEPANKKFPRTRPVDSELRDCSIVLACDSGETFRESFTLKAASPELASAALVNIANARLTFLAHTVRITQLVVPGCPAEEVSLRGAFATQNCNPREGLSVVFNSETDNGMMMLDGVKQYSNRWFHGAPPELYQAVSAWSSRPTAECETLLNQFAQVLNRNGCVIIAQTVLPVRGVISRGISCLPKGELRSKVNQKAAGKRRQRVPGDDRRMVGIVYFIQDDATTSVKIGFCLKKPEKRLAALKTGNANPLHLVGHVPGSELHEKWLHQRFSQFHIQGEWFSNAILADVHGILKCSSLEEWLNRKGEDRISGHRGEPQSAEQFRGTGDR